MHKRLFLCFILIISDAQADSELTIVTEDYPPFQYLDDSGKLTGVSANIVRQVLDDTKIDYQIHVFPWARAFKAGKTSPSTLIFSLLRTNSREDSFHWLVPLCQVSTSFYTLQSRPEVIAKSIADISEYKIGVSREQATKTYLSDKGLEANIIEANKNSQLRKMISFGRIDVVLLSDHYANELKQAPPSSVNQLKLLFTVKELSRKLYLAANKYVSPEIIEKITSSYSKVKSTQLAQCHLPES